MSKKKLSKLLAICLPYVVIGLLATNLGEAWRLAAGKELGDKIVSLMDTPERANLIFCWCSCSTVSYASQMKRHLS